MKSDGYEILRGNMVRRLRDHYKIADERVLAVMNALPRHLFVEPALTHQAYKDNALPIASAQTISQPFIVARMTELLAPEPKHRILEIGAGSGYQTAILSQLAGSVFAIERIAGLAAVAEERLARLGIRNVSVKCADGTAGWDAYAPYDGILVAAGGPEVPQPLLMQLKPGGKLVIPVGNERGTNQRLVVVTRTASGFESADHGPCAFVPLIGEHGWK